MKKNIKYRSNNNYNSQAYSLNYKFDSISSAGKISGTALDLIKRYNELAKEAHGNADYVEAENFRQYAEHYRKIVTEINERKNQRFNQSMTDENREKAPAESNAPVVEQAVAPEMVVQAEEQVSAKASAKRSFTVIEIDTASSEMPVSKASRRGRPTRKSRTEAVAQ